MSGCSMYDCRSAKNAPSDCVCSCKGRNHGARRGVRPQKAKDDAQARRDRKTADAQARQRPRLVPSAPRVRAAAGSGARSLLGTKTGAAVAALAVMFVLGMAIKVVTAVVAWLTVAYAAFVAGVDVVAPWLAVLGPLVLVATQIDWAHVHAWHGRRRDARQAVDQQRADLREQVEAASAPIAIGPAEEIASADEQEWINAGLTRAQYGGQYVPEYVERKKGA